MEIYVIRHTTPDIAKGICYGQSDIPVTDSYEQEVEIILSKVTSPIDVIYTSPLARCLKLAETLSFTKQVDLITDDRLKELNFGDWEMQRWNDIEQTSLMQWMDNYEEACCPNGESYVQLVNRVSDFLKSILATDHQTVAVVTHGGVIKSLKALIHKITLKEAMTYQVAYGAVIRFQV